jgi:hypothetical protein
MAAQHTRGHHANVGALCDEKKRGELAGRKRKDECRRLTTSLHERKEDEQEMRMRVRFVNCRQRHGEA